MLVLFVSMQLCSLKMYTGTLQATSTYILKYAELTLKAFDCYGFAVEYG